MIFGVYLADFKIFDLKFRENEEKHEDISFCGGVIIIIMILLYLLFFA